MQFLLYLIPKGLKCKKQSQAQSTNPTNMNIDRNRSTDLLDQKRNSFGLKYPNNSKILGTKGDVETFFLLLNDLVANNIIEDRFQTISHDLYRTLINHRNIEKFISESVELRNAFSRIESSSVDWNKYPYNRQVGEFDYQKKFIDITKPKLVDVFHRFFSAFEDAPFWVKKYLEQGMINFPRIIVSPTEIGTGRKFKKYTDEDFIDSSQQPLWLRDDD